jgi:signal peptidase I
VAPRAEPREDSPLRNPVDALTHGLPREWRIAIDWAVTILGAVVIVLAIKAYVVNPYRIPSSSMEPTLHCARPLSGCIARFSDRVLANRFIYHFRDPRRGEIVVFKTPPRAQVACTHAAGGGGGDTFVKRLIALPGDRWREQDGYIYINGAKLNEPYIEASRRDAQTIPEKTVPKDQYVMLGDNRSSSCDSRSWGTVPRKNLIGPVFATYWPPRRIGFR